MSENKGLYNKKEAAARLNFDRGTFRRLVNDPSSKFPQPLYGTGKRSYWSEYQLEKWLRTYRIKKHTQKKGGTTENNGD